MVEITKDFIKLIATLIVVLSIFVVVFNSGILDNLFALKTYAEPLTLLDHIASTIETASSCPGECSFSVRTSGLPYILQIYKEDGRYYASIDASLVEQKTNVKFLPNEQKPIFTKPLISDCIISEQKLAFTEGLVQDLNIEKVIEGDTCTISIGSKKVLYDFNITVDPDTLLVLNGTSSATTATVYLIGGSIAPGPVALSTIGLPPDVTIAFNNNNADPTFSSTVIVTAGLTAAPGTYNVTITGTSGGLMRTATLQIEVSAVLYTFILNSAISIIKLPLTNVEVILNSITKYTRTNANDEFTSSIIYSMIPGTPYSVKVENTFADPQGPRPFSHFRDFDCKGNETNYILDTSINSYPFTVPNEYNIVYSRKMTAFYKDFTQIRNLEFDNVTNIISGSLLDEDFNSISKEETNYTACNVSTTVYPNRNVDLYYLDSCSNSWQLLDSVASSFAQNRFYDKFDKDRNNWDIKSGIWNITNDALNNSGIGYESIQTKWNFWNSSDNGNNNLEVSVNLSSGNNVSIRVFDAFDNYYLQTNDSYNNLYLWVNGALKASVPLAGIVPDQWNTWRIRQNNSYLEFYINNRKLIRFYNAPPIDFGRVEFRTFNTQAYFDNVTAYDGSWSYNFDVPCSAKKIKASYTSSDWFYDDTSSVLDIDPTTNPCKLTVNTQIDIGENQESEPLPGIEVNVSDGVLSKIYTKTTVAPLAIAEYFLSSSFFPVHNITVNDTFNSRYFSHFYDQDCNPSNANYWLDNASNPYWFSMCRDKNITAQYKTFTNITNASRSPNTFNFDFPSRTISGFLLDENGNPIINRKGRKHSTCTPQTTYDNVTINRNVTLEYFKNGRWYTIGANDSLADGSWSYTWGCTCNATKLRANYTPIGGNWWYMPNSTEINIVCPCKLTVITQIDVLSTLLSGVRVNVSNIINRTVNGIAIYNLFPGSYYINVDNPFSGRPFSHFYDNDCNKSNMGYSWDNALNPYPFGMFDRDKNITAQYKTFTNITDTRGNTNAFEFNGTTITGRLLDENGKALIEKASGYHPICENSTTINPLLINRNVTLEVYNKTDNKWYYLGVVNVNPSDNISWSFNWNWTSGSTRLRANYTPTNWFYVGTSVEIPLYALTVFTVLDITNNPAVKNVSVTLNGITKFSNILGEAYFMITSMNNNIRVDDIVADAAGSRNYSHFYDHDCNGLGHNLDNSSNPYTFRTWNNDRNITAFYKTFTYIKDSVGTKNKFEYDGNVIKGKLQDERDNYIGTGTNKALVCGNPTVSGVMYRNVTLEYFNGTWNKLVSVEPDTIDGSWSYNWGCACNTTKIRASYNHTDWYYNSTSTEINVDTSLCPCKLTVITQINVFGSPLTGTKVTLDSLLSQNTSIFGKTEFFVRPGFHNITLDTLSDKLNHFYDSDCNKNNQGWWWDKVSSPKDTWNFEMYARERTITAQYRALTSITNTTKTKNTFEFNGTAIKGKLLSEDGNALIEHGHYHQFCEDPTNPSTELPVDRKVTLEYYNGSWQSINSTIATHSPDNGYWEYPWSCTSGSTKLRANYTPISSDWFYVGTNTEIPISCMGTLDVYAFVGGSQVDAKVAIDLGDVNWDGVVNNTDLNLVQNAFGSSPGIPNWCLDCDMNIDNTIDVLDLQTVSAQMGKNIAINKTYFTVNLNSGTYKLRAKYDNQIKNNLTVVVNAGQTTRVDFNFLTCDGFVALKCSVPSLANPGDFRNLTGNCGRVAPDYAKIDCNGVYNSHTVCNSSIVPGPLCQNVEPSISTYSVSSTNIEIGNSFNINVNSNCPSSLPGNCLVECRVVQPNNSFIELDTWSKNPVTTTPYVKCDQVGNYVVDYCAVATDFNINRGWNSVNDTNTIVKCVPSCDMYDRGYSDTDNTQVQCSNHNYLSYTSANQMRNYSYNGTACDCNVTYDSYITSNCIKGVCSGDSSVLSNEYVNITTSIRNTGKNNQTSWFFGVEIFNVSNYTIVPIDDTNRHWDSRAWASFDGNTKAHGCWNRVGVVSNCDCNYADPNKNGVLDVGETINVSCWIPASYWPVSTGNRRVMFWSHEQDTTKDANNNGVPGQWWDDALSRKEPSELRAKIEAPTPFTLTFNSQVDITREKLPGFEVNINGTIKYTSGADASVTYSLIPGTYNISVLNPDDGRYFSHFYDNNCDNLGNAWDKIDNPFTFTMFNNNKNVTAQYKTFTKIKSSSGGTIDDFEDGNYNLNPTWNLNCGGVTSASMVAGYGGSANALKLTSTGGDGLACAIKSNYNAIEGRKITYACYGGRCRLCVTPDRVSCINDPIDCGNNIENWAMCQTTITASNLATWIYIYNNNALGGWSVYDLIEESTFDYDDKTISGKLLDETNIVLYQVGGGSPNCGGARQTIPIDKNINLGYYTGSWNPIGSPKFYDDFNDNDYLNNPPWTVQSGTWSVPWGELNNTGFGNEQIVTNWSGWSGNNFLSANVRLEKFNPPNTDYDMFIMITNWSQNYYVQTWNGYKDLQLYVADGAGYHHAYGVDIRPLSINPNNWNLWKIDQKGNDLLVYINNNLAMNTSKERKIIDDFEDGECTNPLWEQLCIAPSDGKIQVETGGYLSSSYKLNVSSSGGHGLACAVLSNYNAIEGRKVNYACFGNIGSACKMCFYDEATSTCINDHTCNLNTGQCFDGNGPGQTCGESLGSWTICETTITQTKSGIKIYIYNDMPGASSPNRWSVYDLIEESIKVPRVNNGQIQLRTNYAQALFDDVNVDGVIYSKDGSWSYPWNQVIGSTRLRAVYNPINWYYNYTSAEISINCGNGVCDSALGEDCGTCAADCKCTGLTPICCPSGLCGTIALCPL